MRKNSSGYISHLSKKNGLWIYLISIVILLLIVFIYFDEISISLPFLGALILYTSQNVLFRFINIDKENVYIESIFLKTEVYTINEISRINQIIPFSSVSKIKFSNGKSFYFLANDKAQNFR
ncbi:hypothetical protein OC25_07840 [Pedobacter kyungheensis]|uniref:Uncharacterized protein n=1 Tax=Pedobacter kyungheensis TaxID=1069985 RepID=A0A0C1G4Z9_9SPHI|nr:hypothetical protein OC25_07840 [Pedobacter kyungheensis]